MNFLKKFFGQGNTPVKVEDPITQIGLQAEKDLWDNNMAADPMDPEAAQKYQAEVASAALKFEKQEQAANPTEGKPPVA